MNTFGIATTILAIITAGWFAYLCPTYVRMTDVALQVMPAAFGGFASFIIGAVIFLAGVKRNESERWQRKEIFNFENRQEIRRYIYIASFLIFSTLVNNLFAMVDKNAVTYAILFERLVIFLNVFATYISFVTPILIYRNTTQ